LSRGGKVNDLAEPQEKQLLKHANFPFHNPTEERLFGFLSPLLLSSYLAEGKSEAKQDQNVTKFAN
jgi:hypothetical protein